MRFTKTNFSILLTFSFALIFSSITKAQSTSRCYQVAVDDIDNILDSLEHLYSHRIQVPRSDIRTFLQDQLDVLPINVDLPPPEPHFTSEFLITHFFRWDWVLAQEEDYQPTAFNLEVPNTRETLPASKVPGAAFPFDNNQVQEFWLYSFFTMHEDKQSILNIIIIDKDVSFTCERQKGLKRTTIQNESLNQAKKPKLLITPNPFDEFASLAFEMPFSSPVTLEVYDLAGRLVKTPIQQQVLQEGTQQIQFDASDLPAGTYYCTLNWEGPRASELLIKAQK